MTKQQSEITLDKDNVHISVCVILEEVRKASARWATAADRAVHAILILRWCVHIFLSSSSQNTTARLYIISLCLFSLTELWTPTVDLSHTFLP